MIMAMPSFAKLTANFTNVENDKPKINYFTADLIINNTSDALSVSRLEFDTPRLIYNITLKHEIFTCRVVGQEKIEKGCYQTGGHVYLHFMRPIILKTGKTALQLKGQYFIKHDTDGVAGLYVSTAVNSHTLAIPVRTKLPNDIDRKNIPLTPQQIYQQNQHRLAKHEHLSGYLIPKPVKAHWDLHKASFRITNNIAIATNSNLLHRSEVLLRQYFGLRENVINSKKSVLLYLTNQSFTNTALKPFQRRAAYKLIINPQKITIKAHTLLGIFYGIQSLRQLYLISKNNRSIGIIPSGKVIDYPRFPYRGLMLDVSRNFFSISDIKTLLDLMALNKLNVFHWHLTDDEGWRLKNPNLPNLTTVGAVRGDNPMGYAHQLSESFGSGAALIKGQFYSQGDVEKVLAYAKRLHITVMPEIDVPGHARALKLAYPDLFSPNDDAKYLSVQNYSDDVLDVCYPETYKKLSNILKRVATQFPSTFIHLGGDEVAEGAWHNGRLIQQECKNFTSTDDPKQLAHIFMDKLGKLLLADGKKLAAWDEVGLNKFTWKNISPSDIRLYLWHYDNLADEINRLANEGYQLVLTPANELYFDLAYGSSPREPGYYWATGNKEHDSYTAYNYKPLAGVRKYLRSHVLGLQGALWSENLVTNKRMQYMAFPRVAALAELAWSPAIKRNWNSFAHRIGHYYLTALDSLGVNYRLPLPGIIHNDGKVFMNVAFPGLAIHYTTDGSKPTSTSLTYRRPFSSTGVIKAVSCSREGSCSRVSKVKVK